MKLSDTLSLDSLLAALEGEDDFVFLDTGRPGIEDSRSLLFCNPRTWLRCKPDSDAGAFLDTVECWLQRGCFIAGWFSYEFGYLLEPALLPLLDRRTHELAQAPLALLGVFEQPLILDPALPTLPRAEQSLAPAAVKNIRVSQQRAEYLEAVVRIREYIRAGDTYQVNYTLKLLFDYAGSAASFYRMLRHNQSVAYAAWIRQGGREIMSFSPELFFRSREGRIRVRPMKGTMSRGRTLREDTERGAALQKDEKNRAENIMIVDLLRNDLARLIHENGGGRVKPVSLFDVERYETLLQMTSTVDALPDGKIPGLKACIKALFPCGSVTGAPKIHTMEIIRELENQARGVYTGAIGFAGPDEMAFNVPIRTLVLENGQGEMGIGSGIVHDSDPQEEWGECLLKARFLTRPRPEFQLIETLLWRPCKGYWLLEEHLERLESSAAYFLYSCDIEAVRERLLLESAGFAAPVRIRLLLYPNGSLQIRSAPCPEAMDIFSLHPAVNNPLPQICISRQAMDAQSPFLFHKTTCRDIYTEELAAAKGCFEVIFRNEQGAITEGSFTNIFIRSHANAPLLTPPLSCGLLNGTLRRYLLASRPDEVQEAVLMSEDILSAEDIYLGNSVRGLLRVELRADVFCR